MVRTITSSINFFLMIKCKLTQNLNLSWFVLVLLHTKNSSSEKAIINVGSVGQPRDRDNRASYAYVDGSDLHFVRLDYDHEAAAKKIYDVKELENFEGDRLFEGK